MDDNVLTIINSRDYDLSDLTSKIYALWIKGYLTDEQKDELCNKAIENASIDSALPSLSDRVAALEERVAKLEGDKSSGGTSGSSDWPEWVQPTGAHDAYAKGAQVTHSGTKYVSMIDANVWEPGVLGSESLWSESK